MVDVTALQNLNLQDQIVTPQGTATPFFMRLLQRKNVFSGDLASAVEHLDAFEITTTAPISGGPVVLGTDAALTISHAASGVTPGSYVNANITVDAKGHVTAAANGASGSAPTLNEVPTGAINGVNATFVLTATPSAAGISLFLNGLLLKPTTDYSLAVATITMVAAPLTGDVLLVNYFT